MQVKALLALGIRSLLDLLETGIRVGDPIPRFIDFSRTHWARARNRLRSRYQLSLILHRFCAFDREFPVMREFVNRVNMVLASTAFIPLQRIA